MRLLSSSTALLRLFALAVALAATACCAVGAPRKKAADHRFTVVIDPGHGGKDSGCKGKTACEKDIVLDVARRLGDKLRDGMPDTKVVFTRDDDRFLTLQERADVANKANGSIFVSIHVNSVDYKTRGRENVKGASVYTLGTHRNASNLNVAMRENAVMELEDDYSTTYHGFDPSSTESYIIFELSQSSHMQQSIRLADMIQRSLVSKAGRHDNSVRQAGFWVLWATSMPAVLVELDFICNPECERFLNSGEGRERCAEAIYRAVKQYHSENRHTAPVKPEKVTPSKDKRNNS